MFKTVYEQLQHSLTFTLIYSHLLLFICVYHGSEVVNNRPLVPSVDAHLHVFNASFRHLHLLGSINDDKYAVMIEQCLFIASRQKIFIVATSVGN